MITKVPRLTQSGQNLLLRAIAGEEVTFTRFKIGNGELPEGSDGTELTDLINPLVVFGISDLDDSNEGYLLITGHFNSLDVPSEMKFRELGIFAKGEDDIEKLYAYVNDGNEAGTLMPNLSNIYSEQQITLVIAIGEAEHVTAELVPDTLYAAKSDFDDHVNDVSNPHGVTKAQVGLSEVPNVSTNNQTPTYTGAGSLTALASGEKLSVAFGKISKAISSLISHLANTSNPHGVTRTQIGAAAASHTHTTDNIISGVLPVERGGTGASSYDRFASLFRSSLFYDMDLIPASMDLNTVTRGIYSVNPGATNAPTSNTGYTLLCFQNTNSMVIEQWAISTGNPHTIYHRSRYGFFPYDWTAWT